VLRPPLDGRIRSATIDGKAARTDGESVVVPAAPAHVVLRMESSR
jgi:hypothetical protein